MGQGVCCGLGSVVKSFCGNGMSVHMVVVVANTYYICIYIYIYARSSFQTPVPAGCALFTADSAETAEARIVAMADPCSVSPRVHLESH